MGRYVAVETQPAVFGFHKTRAGVAFSPWNADTGVPLHAPSSLDLDALFRASLMEKAVMIRGGHLGQADEPVVLDEVSSSPPMKIRSSEPPTAPSPTSSPFDSCFSSPLSSPPSSPILAAPVEVIPVPLGLSPLSPAVALPASRVGNFSDGLSKAQFHAKQKVQRKREKRRESRAKAQLEAGSSLKAACLKHRSGGKTFAADFALRPENVYIASTGIIGRALRVHNEVRKGTSLKNAQSLGFRYVNWSGKDPCYITDCHGTIFTMLVGEPKDAEWPSLIKRVSDKFADAQRRMAELEDEPDHRRGRYFYGHVGHSIGSGQQRPGNLCNSARRQEILEGLRNDPDVIRVANFASASLNNYVPEVYKVYEDNLEALLDSDASLRRNFPRNVFSAATFNLGPRVFTRKHLDHLNFAYGMCAVLALGNYNYKKGGHIILWDAKLIIEFPPGATILLPSAILRHSNISIGRNETRYLFTQYTAGGLFRWVRAGFRTLRSLRASGGDLSSGYEEWKDGWKLYPTVSDMYGQDAL